MIVVEVGHQMPVVTVERRGTTLQSALTLLLTGLHGKEWKYLSKTHLVGYILLLATITIPTLSGTQGIGGNGMLRQ